MSCPPRLEKPDCVEQLEERRDAGRHDRVEHGVGAGRGDPLDGLDVVHVVHGVVLLADDRSAVGGDDLAHAGVEHARPDVVGGGQVEGPRPGLAHQPRDERVDLLRRHRAGAEDERIALLPLVLLGVDVERSAVDDRGLLDGLARAAVDAAQDHVDPVVLDELLGLGRRNRVVGRAVLDMQLELTPEQAAFGVDVADDHPRDVRVGQPHERERACLVGDEPDLDVGW